jgi:hypothetical protein
MKKEIKSNFPFFRRGWLLYLSATQAADANLCYICWAKKLAKNVVIYYLQNFAEIDYFSSS